jgi:hypothetical protein
MTSHVSLNGNPIKWVIVVLIILWLAGFIQIPIFNTAIFSVFGRPFTIHHLLILLIVGYIIRFLPGILQTAVAILLILWLVSTFLIVSLGGLANLFFLIIIIAILFSIF